MPGEHRRPQRETDLTDFFAAVPWRVVPLALLAVDGGIVAFANANDWPWPTTKLLLIGATLLLGATGVGGLVKKLEHRRLLASARQLDDLRALTPRAFEELVHAAYRRQGWSGSLTGRGADGGIDVILQRGGETVYVQCKRWTWQTIPVEGVRALKGSMATQNVARGIFVCCGRLPQKRSDTRRAAALPPSAARPCSTSSATSPERIPRRRRPRLRKRIRLQRPRRRHARAARSQWCGAPGATVTSGAAPGSPAAGPLAPSRPAADRPDVRRSRRRKISRETGASWADAGPLCLMAQAFSSSSSTTWSSPLRRALTGRAVA